MLKLEKKARQQEVVVTVRHCPRTFNRTFFKALLAATAIHFIGFSLFTIQSIQLPEVTYLPATVVNVWNPVAIESAPEKRGEHARFVPFSSPKAPSVPIFIIKEPVVDSYQHNFVDFYVPVRFALSGGIANHEIVAPALGEAVPNKSVIQEYALSYAIQIDERSGRVFWFLKEQGTENVEINRLAESLLRQLQFRQHPDLVLSRGTIEVMITQPLGAS